MKAVVIGAGKTGYALAVHLLKEKYEVVVYSRSRQKADFFSNNKLEVTGILAGRYRVKTTSNLTAAVANADIVFVATWANAHNDVLKNIASLLSSQQSIIFLNGNWGALEAVSYLGQDSIGKLHLEIGETSGMPYVAEFKDRNHLEIKQIKELVTLSVFNLEKRASEKVVTLFKKLYTSIEIARNIIATSLTSLNPIIHVPAVIFNLARIERQDNFSILVDGLTPKVANFIMKIDSERRALAKELGIPYNTIVAQLSEQWGREFPDLPTLFSTLGTYKNLQAPKSFNSRFIVEDLPFGIDPLVKLGSELDVGVRNAELLAAFTHSVLEEQEKADLSFISKKNIDLVLNQP